MSKLVLKSCPFCGEASLCGTSKGGVLVSDLWFVWCFKCEMRGPARETEADAISTWEALHRHIWQPIETAPEEDRVHILLANWCGYMQVGYWNDDPWGHGRGPTHWMPLPEAPK